VSDTREYPTHPKHPLNTGYTTPTRTPYHIESAQVELRSGRVVAPALDNFRNDALRLLKMGASSSRELRSEHLRSDPSALSYCL